MKNLSASRRSKPTTKLVMDNETATGSTITSCRYCLESGGRMKNLFTVYLWNGTLEVYSQMISETLNVVVTYSDSTQSLVSTEICEFCIEQLRNASKFKKLVQNTEEILQQTLHSSQDLNSIKTTNGVVSEKETDCQRMEEKLTHAEAYIKAVCGDIPPTLCPNLTPINNKDIENKESEYPDLKIVKEEPVSESLKPVSEVQRSSPCNTEVMITAASKKTRKKGNKYKKIAFKADSQCKNNDVSTEDVVRKNSIAILRHSTAYPFQPTKRLFRCCFCPYTPDRHDPTSFRLHMKSQHGDIDKSICLKHHNESMRRVDITNLRCNDCGDDFSSLEDVAKHLIDVHSYDIDLSQSLGLVPIRLRSDRFACVICSKSYTTLHQLSRHSGTHFYRNICYKCGRNFETLKGLKKHVTFAHSKHKFMCQKCRTPFPDLNSKKEHLKNNTKCRSFKCKLCRETFITLETQHDHLVKVHGEAKITYPCPECGDVFEKRIGRYLHFKMAHTDDFKCSHCGTKFSNNRCLQDHTARIHTFERKYQCSVCNKAFLDARTLRTHTFIHDASKKQPCPVCNRAFTMKIRLKYHLQKYHPDVFSDVFPVASSE